MKEELFRIGPFVAHSYGAMIALGVFAAVFVAERRARKIGLNDTILFSLALWCLGGGMLGAKLLYLITELDAIIAGTFEWNSMLDGFVVYGGILGGILTGFIYVKCKKLPFLPYFDLVMPSIALAQGFGRIGCFLAGCCYGRETDSVFGVVFKNSNYAPNNVALLPTQLISSAADFLHFFLLVFLAKKVKKEGMIGAFYLIFYSIGRFLIEFLRNDPRGGVLGLSTSQFISVFILLVGVGLLVFFAKRKDKTELE